MNFLTDLFSGGAAQLVNSIGDTLDKVVTTKEEKLQLEQEMKRAERQYEIDMRKLNIAEEELVFNDIKGARSMNADVQNSTNATKLAKNISSYLALGTIVLTFILFFIVLFVPQTIEADRKDIVVYILGVLSAVASQIFSFYFGSSQGSADKSKQLHDLSNKMAERQ